jgi:hypothetical protein
MSQSSLAQLWAQVRRVAFAVAAVIIVIGLIEIMPAEMAFLFAGDILTYLEIGALLWLSATGGRLRAAWRQAQRMGLGLLRSARRSVRRLRNGFARGTRRPRAVRPARGEPADPDPAGLAWA